jgi:hypothetical protein
MNSRQVWSFFFLGAIAAKIKAVKYNENQKQ